MRGDSRIDLYAKSLALLGLGLIAGIGAAVDYWPGDLRLPSVARSPVRPLIPAARTFVDTAVVVDADLTVQEPRGSDPTVAFASAREAAPTGPARVELSSDVAYAAAPELAITVSNGGDLPSLDLESGLAASNFPAAALTPADLMPAATMTSDVIQVTSGLQPLPPMLPVDQSDDGFFSGMLRKTGSSVGNSLASVSSSLDKAGTSLAGAVRVVSDLVKKAF